MNKHKGMRLVSIWFAKDEYEALISKLECNENDEVINILHKILERGGFP